MKKLLVAAALLSVAFSSNAQTYLTRSAQVTFFSTTSAEDIKATNNEVVSVIDGKSGAYNFTVLIKSFIFPKAAMQQHFNGEGYMNSDKFPKAEFKGSIDDIKKSKNLKKDGTYKVMVSGDLTMHGITKKVTAPGTITITGGKVTATSVFKINRKDYGVEIPDMAKGKIAEDLEITINAAYDEAGK